MRSGCNICAAAVDFHIAAPLLDKQLVHRELHIAVVAYFAVGKIDLRKRRAEKRCLTLQSGTRSILSEVRIPDLSRITENVHEVGILRRLVGRTLYSDCKIRTFALRVLIEFTAKLSLGLHQTCERNRMSVRRVAAGITAVSELVEKDSVCAEGIGIVDMLFEDIYPLSARGTRNGEGLVAEDAGKDSCVAEIVKLAVFGSVRAFDGYRLTVSAAVEV